MPAEKAAHLLSNCQACALNSPKEQKPFPLKQNIIVDEAAKKSNSAGMHLTL